MPCAEFHDRVKFVRAIRQKAFDVNKVFAITLLLALLTMSKSGNFLI
jgi:hypothetical protein